MFRTVLVHHQKQHLQAVHRIWYMSIVQQQPDVCYRHIHFLSDSNQTSGFSVDFPNLLQIPNFMKIRLVGRRVVSCGRRDGHGEANSRFSQFFRQLK